LKKLHQLAFVIAIIAMVISTSKAQHTAREVGVSFAVSGQGKIEKRSLENRGFFQDAFIFHLRAQVSTNGIQNLSFFIERVSETREYDAQEDINGKAEITHQEVSVAQTSFGLETFRTVVSTGGFRVGLGVGLGIGMGTPSRTIEVLRGGGYYEESSESPWLSLLLTATARARYTVYRKNDLDVGLTLSGRYWGFPAIGPSSSNVNGYNGPDFRTLHQVGYLAGVSVGF
jgi:hypothetical protein